MVLEIKINGRRRSPDWGLYLQGEATMYPYVIIEAAYGNQSFEQLTEDMLEYISDPCCIMAAIGIKLFKPRKNGVRRVMVGSATSILIDVYK